MMTSKALHKSLTARSRLPLSLLLLLFLLPLFVCVRSQPLPDADEPAPQLQPMLFIQNMGSPEDAKNYEITITKDRKPGEPCLTIKWKTNPDGSGPEDPKIYWLNGYFRIVTGSSDSQSKKVN